MKNIPQNFLFYAETGEQSFSAFGVLSKSQSNSKDCREIG